MKRVAQSCGALGMGTVDRILRNLRFDLGQRKVLLVFDEAQHLSIACLETLRELLDQPPHCGLLFAGTHELEEIFTRQALELEQWRSRFHAAQALPGISEEEAATIVHSELGLGLSQRKIQKLISKSRITDLRDGRRHSYVSARRQGTVNTHSSPIVIKDVRSEAGAALAINVPSKLSQEQLAVEP
jgi:type II secretory pathway predicted ATPase ExeA